MLHYLIILYLNYDCFQGNVWKINEFWKIDIKTGVYSQVERISMVLAIFFRLVVRFVIVKGGYIEFKTSGYFTEIYQWIWIKVKLFVYTYYLIFINSKLLDFKGGFPHGQIYIL